MAAAAGGSHDIDQQTHHLALIRCRWQRHRGARLEGGAVTNASGSGAPSHGRRVAPYATCVFLVSSSPSGHRRGPERIRTVRACRPAQHGGVRRLCRSRARPVRPLHPAPQPTGHTPPAPRRTSPPRGGPAAEAVAPGSVPGPRRRAPLHPHPHPSYPAAPWTLPPPPPLQSPRIHRLRTLRRGEARPGGPVRPRPGARRDHRAQALPLRPHLFLAQGRGRQARRGGVEIGRPPARHEPRERGGGDRHRADHHLCRPLVLPAHGRAAGIRRRRRAAGADRGAAGAAGGGRPVRSRPQAADPDAAGA